MSLSCPNCGAPLELQHRSVKLTVCAYCQTASAIENDRADPLGKSATLIDDESFLRVGMVGQVRGRGFSIAGRLRFEYEDGYWDEWFTLFSDGTNGWIHDDEGDLTLLQKQTVTAPVPAFDSIRVGQKVQVGDQLVYIREKSTAEVLGGEGQLAMRVVPGAPIAYADGMANGQAVMLEWADDGLELCIGVEIDPDEIEVDM